MSPRVILTYSTCAAIILHNLHKYIQHGHVAEAIAFIFLITHNSNISLKTLPSLVLTISTHTLRYSRKQYTLPCNIRFCSFSIKRARRCLTSSVSSNSPRRCSCGDLDSCRLSCLLWVCKSDVYVKVGSLEVPVGLGQMCIFRLIVGKGGGGDERFTASHATHLPPTGDRMCGSNDMYRRGGAGRGRSPIHLLILE